MGDANDRLRQARERAKFKSATAAARKFHWTVSTYLSHENGQTDVPAKEARKYAKAFKVSAGWLLTGEGPMDAQNLAKLMGRIGAGAEIHPEHEQIPEDGLEEIELPFQVGLDAIAFEIEGDSMLPRYDAGALIVCSNSPRNPDDFIGVEVAVRTAKGQRYLKTLRHGSRKGLYNLESFNARLIPDVKLAWIGEILAVIPSHRRAPVATRKRASG